MNDPRVARRGESRLTIAADVSQLGPLRAAVADFARRSEASEDVVETFELAASELATNVIQHTTSDEISVAFGRTENGWQLDVADAEGLEGRISEGRPDPSQLAGRGLFIVEAVMDSVELIVIDGHQYLRCVKHAS